MLVKPRISMKILFALLPCMFLIGLIETTQHAQEQDIQIVMNGETLTLNQQPTIQNGRTLVPLRGIFESMGVDVGWNPSAKQVTAVKENEVTISLFINNPYVTINQQTIAIDQPAIILNGSTMVPLRFISEALGADVQWSNQERTVYIDSEPNPGQVPVPKPSAESSKLNSILELEIGQDVSYLTAQWGEPSRIDQSASGYEWWIYNQDLNHYFQVGIEAGKIVDIYTSAPISYGGMTNHQSRVEQSISQDVIAAVSGAQVTFHNRDGMKQLIKAAHPTSGNEEYLIYYLDSIEQNTIAAIRKIKPELLIKQTMFSWNATIHDQQTFTAATTSASIDSSVVSAAMEKQVLDLTNTDRLKHGIQPLLKENDRASDVARAHSRDMSTKQYFAHNSPDGRSPFDRLGDAGITYLTAGENIASGYGDAIEVHHGWMNSPGHRKNILNDDFTTLGVGIFEKYYTQNFVTPR